VLDTLALVIATALVPAKREDRAGEVKGIPFAPKVAMATERTSTVTLQSGEAIQTRKMIAAKRPELPIGE
jgi:hypothetical protein